MNEDDVARRLLDGVVSENSAEYRKLFKELTQDEITDPYWQDALKFFDSLSPSRREVFFSILRQVSIDTVSTVAGALDGTTDIGLHEDLYLVASNGEKMRRNLQSSFLEAVESAAAAN